MARKTQADSDHQRALEAAILASEEEVRRYHNELVAQAQRAERAEGEVARLTKALEDEKQYMKWSMDSYARASELAYERGIVIGALARDIVRLREQLDECAGK